MALLLPPLSSVPPPSSSHSRSARSHVISPYLFHASSETGGKDGNEPEAAPPEGSQLEAASVENLPLESKLQMKLEQKLRMKLAKKIQLRRKRLLRKRKMRKKGRWPPSKMKKLKNV
ncbi:hypothetical protein Cni_G15521 [Canna indica]|uniref:50S ribosomal protein 5, chloroplastic n=1 Tax=Canna indica TaxID=4628 RepID=A0AAQ3KE92_9LILI|nr:hypothetical protein Cni_G15521 [Canna indica]